MKRFLTPMALIILVAALAACNSPQPVPVAPTAIPTLIPATLPAPTGGSGAQPIVTGVNFPTTPPAQAAGEAIYAEKCAACHGTDGNGKVEGARNFTDLDYVRGSAPVAFFQSITGGKGNMPAFKDELSDEERWNVTYYLNQFSVKAADVAAGKPVFEANCVSCHGPNGEGAIPQAAKFTPEFISKFPATEFYQAVSAGKGIMPAWQDRLSSDERWAAVEYVRAFAYKPAGE